MSLGGALEKEIVARLDILIRLTAAGVTGGKTVTDQIRLLSQTGLDPKDIASLIGKKAHTVRGTLSKLRKPSRKKRK